MSTPENKVKVFIDKYILDRFPGSFKYSPPGIGYFGKNGMPDRIWFIPSGNKDFPLILAIEAKAENGEPTVLQLKTLSKLARIGVIAAIVVGKDLAHMERIKDEILRRIHLATSMLQAVQQPNQNDRIPDQE